MNRKPKAKTNWINAFTDDDNKFYPDVSTPDQKLTPRQELIHAIAVACHPAMFHNDNYIWDEADNIAGRYGKGTKIAQYYYSFEADSVKGKRFIKDVRQAMRDYYRHDEDTTGE